MVTRRRRGGGRGMAKCAVAGSLVRCGVSEAVTALHCTASGDCTVTCWCTLPHCHCLPHHTTVWCGVVWCGAVLVAHSVVHGSALLVTQLAGAVTHCFECLCVAHATVWKQWWSLVKQHSHTEQRCVGVHAITWWSALSRGWPSLSGGCTSNTHL